ncbi:MAG: hypothetical protein HQL53_04160 [Magnetococcales bacterium]|nr:hypothetical protein [Magnetococcales bacterium]
MRLREPLALRGRHRAVVTVLGPMEDEDISGRRRASALQDWRRFAGIIKDSPHFRGDPVEAQKAMRDEWE